MGGHSIEDPEPKFGLAVTGMVRPAAAVTNRGAKVGDAIVLTKPLGTGVVANALKKGVAPAAAVDEAVASMTKLNREGARAMVAFGATAATDVTGFGLLAHLHNILEASACAASLQAREVPVFEVARRLFSDGHVPGGSKRNLEAAAAYTRFEDGVPPDSAPPPRRRPDVGWSLLHAPERAGRLAALRFRLRATEPRASARLSTVRRAASASADASYRSGARVLASRRPFGGVHASRVELARRRWSPFRLPATSPP